MKIPPGRDKGRGDNPDAVDRILRTSQAIHRNGGAIAIEDLLSSEKLSPEDEDRVRSELLRMVLDETTDLGAQNGAPPGIANAAGKPPVPARIGKYPILRAIAAHGQGEVYLAVHPDLGIQLAIKWCRDACGGAAGACGGAAEAERLREEGRILASLSEPGIARVYDLDVHDGRPFIAMEFIAGVTLEQEGDGGMDWQRAARLLARTTRALAAAHRAGVLHLDIKPANIIVGRDGEPRLIDFGLARHRGAWRVDDVEDGFVSGTLPYMPPEQARGENDRLDRRTDVCALGGVLYFLLTGDPPFTGSSRSEIYERARRCEWDPDALERAVAPQALKNICRRALSPEQDARHPSAEAFAAEIESVLARSSTASRRRTLARRGLLFLGAAAAIAGAVHFFVLPSGPESAVLGPVRVRIARDDAPGGERESAWVEIVHRLPLLEGDLLGGEVLVAPGHHAAVLSYAGGGRWRRLASLDKSSPERRLGLAPAGKALPLVGPRRTELVLACARRSAPIEARDLEGLWPEGGDLPELPAASLLRLDGAGVAVEQSGRDLGTPVDAPDGEGEVRRRLVALGARLRQSFDAVSALAFLYAQAPPE